MPITRSKTQQVTSIANSITIECEPQYNIRISVIAVGYDVNQKKGGLLMVSDTTGVIFRTRVTIPEVFPFPFGLWGEKGSDVVIHLSPPIDGLVSELSVIYTEEPD